MHSAKFFKFPTGAMKVILWTAGVVCLLYMLIQGGEYTGLTVIILLFCFALQDNHSRSEGYKKGYCLGYDAGYEDAKKGEPKDPTYHGALL